MTIKKQKKGLLRIIFGRTAIVIFLLVLQLLVLLGSFMWLKEFMVYIYSGSVLISAAVVIYIINDKGNPEFKLVWMIPVLLFPIFGALLYLYVKADLGAGAATKRCEKTIEETRPYLKQGLLQEIDFEDKKMLGLLNYICESGGYPAYGNTRAKYFPLGEEKFEEMKLQLEAAQKFIFMEYFIIESGFMWESILEILKRKAAQGVEVRVMYDGMCSIALLPYHYPKQLEAMGIKCKMFNPILPALSTNQNNRDHRKVLVIDGKVGFTGGINLADEYINRITKFGHWKDVAIMLEGDAVKSLTLMFLQMWNVTELKPEGYENYINIDFSGHNYTLSERKADGYIIPYADSPLDGEHVGERVYMDILNTATEYVHIMTPYLILDYEMIVALTYAAKRGVDVKIIMPHIPDKWVAFAIARTYYPELIEAGVKIYEYTPGFVHAKCFVSDHTKAVVGTINLDYRSLYLHFECAVLLYKNETVRDVEEDFQKTLEKCCLITADDYNKFGIFSRLAGRVLRLFGPLM